MVLTCNLDDRYLGFPGMLTCDYCYTVYNLCVLQNNCKTQKSAFSSVCEYKPINSINSTLSISMDNIFFCVKPLIKSTDKLPFMHY